MEDEEMSPEMLALGAFECVLSELLVALLASGALTRHEVAKALLRAEVMAATHDASSEPPRAQAATAEYVRVLLDLLTPRLGLRPNLFVLRQQRERWMTRPGRAPDPIETRAPIVEPEPDA